MWDLFSVPKQAPQLRARGVVGPHRRRQCSDLTQVCSTTSLGTTTAFPMYCLLWSVMILSLKGVSEGGGRKEYLNCVWPRLLSDVRLIGPGRTLPTALSHKNKLNDVLLLLILKIVHLMSKGNLSLLWAL